MEGEGRENKESDRGKKNILSMQMRRGKQKHRRSSWPPGPCQSSLSPFLFLSRPLTVYLSTPGPRSPVACGYTMKGRWGEEMGTG